MIIAGSIVLGLSVLMMIGALANSSGAAGVISAVVGIIVGAVALTITHFAENSSVWWMDIFKDVGIDQIFKHFPFWFMMGLGVAVNSSRPIKAAINDFVFFVD